MLNYIWCGMIAVSFLTAIFTGRTNAVMQSVIDGATAAAEICFSLIGVMCLWTGIAKIAEDSGLTAAFARLLRPVTRLIFPRLEKNSAALRAIVMNMVANLFGMGNAATPLGLAAMRELDKINPDRNSVSDEMCTFVVLNTASIQLIPATVIALRAAAGSRAPSEIIVPVWVCSACAVSIGMLAVKFFERRERKK